MRQFLLLSWLHFLCLACRCETGDQNQRRQSHGLMYTRTASVTKTASHDYMGRGLPFDQQTVQRRKKGECPLRLNESRWTARGVSSRPRYNPARVADSAAESVHQNVVNLADRM